MTEKAAFLKGLHQYVENFSPRITRTKVPVLIVIMVLSLLFNIHPRSRIILSELIGNIGASSITNRASDTDSPPGFASCVIYNWTKSRTTWISSSGVSIIGTAICSIFHPRTNTLSCRDPAKCYKQKNSLVSLLLSTTWTSFLPNFHKICLANVIDFV